MIPLCPALLIAAANAFVGSSDESEDGGEAARLAERLHLFLHDVHQPTVGPLSAGFVSYVGRWSHYDEMAHGSSWPLPDALTCDELAGFAYQRGVLSVERPTVGELFLVWSPTTGEFERTGIVLGLNEEVRGRDGSWWYDCHTIEVGNSGSSWRAFRARRRVSPELGDRLIRWVDLDARGAVSDPGASVEQVGGRIVLRRAA